MDLLEKAQMKKQQIKESDTILEEDTTHQEQSNEESNGLLSKIENQVEDKEDLPDLYIQYDGKQEIEIIEEEEGYGYKNLGSRRIVFDHNINEYRYELIEPELNETEKELKNELAHLFKMLADIDTFDMDEEEKVKFLAACDQNQCRRYI